MDRRTRILAGVFGIGILYALVSGVVYPKWIEPQLKIEQTIAKKRQVYDKLRARAALVDRAKEEYRELAARVGSFDAGKVQNDIRERLNALIEKHGLRDASVSLRGPTRDRKTDVQRMVITVSATTGLESAIGFLEDVAELPHIARVRSLKLSPASSRRRSGRNNQVKVTVPLELLVLGQHKLVGRIREVPLGGPAEFVRHQDRDYSSMWTPNPFTEYEELVVNAGHSVVIDEGGSAMLRASASGGRGNYTYEWSPEDELSDPTIARPRVTDTSVPGRREFTLTVTDGAGATATAEVVVTIRRKEKAVVEVTPEDPVKPVLPVGPRRWPERGRMQLRMVMRTDDGSKRRDESMIYNSRSQKTSYYKVGDDFDGGRLVFVHQTGLLVRRQNDYFVYPLGAKLDQDTAADDAVGYPVLMDMAGRARAAEELAARQAEEAVGQDDLNSETAKGLSDSASDNAQEEGKTEPSETAEAKDGEAEDEEDSRLGRRPGGRRPRRPPARRPGKTGKREP